MGFMACLGGVGRGSGFKDSPSVRETFIARTRGEKEQEIGDQEYFSDSEAPLDICQFAVFTVPEHCALGCYILSPNVKPSLIAEACPRQINFQIMRYRMSLLRTQFFLPSGDINERCFLLGFGLPTLVCHVYFLVIVSSLGL